MKRLVAVLAVLGALWGGVLLAQETDVPLKAEKPPEKECLPNVGCVTNLPLPRFVSLKGSEGNARRGFRLTDIATYRGKAQCRDIAADEGRPVDLALQKKGQRHGQKADGPDEQKHLPLGRKEADKTPQSLGFCF